MENEPKHDEERDIKISLSETSDAVKMCIYLDGYRDAMQWSFKVLAMFLMILVLTKLLLRQLDVTE